MRFSPIGKEPFKIPRYLVARVQAEMRWAGGRSVGERAESAQVFSDTATRVVVHGLRCKQPNGLGVVRFRRRTTGMRGWGFSRLLTRDAEVMGMGVTGIRV